jgi:DNA-binding SARP family transcriptional activator
MTTTEIRLLGRFAVHRAGRDIGDGAWVRRSASGLVKILALAPDRRLHRERVLDALWPDLLPEDAGPRLHTATHYARRALGDRGAVAVRGGVLALLPDDEVDVDVHRFDDRARTALRNGSAADVDAALAAYGGPLLPDDAYDPWTAADRDHLHGLHVDVLRAGRRWEELLGVDPADKQAHLELMRCAAARGDVLDALRRFERLERALQDVLGTRPGQQARALRDGLLARDAPGPVGDPVPRPVDRSPVRQRLERAMLDLRRGQGGTALISGPPGAGTSSLLAWVQAQARSQGVRVGSGAASIAEGGWPYAPVLESLADLCRQHPSLVQRLDGVYGREIEQALLGGELRVFPQNTHQLLFLSVAQLLRLAGDGPGVVLTVDDLAEADDASLRLLHYVARTTVRAPVLLVAGFRGGPPGTRLEQWRASLLRRHVAVDLRLAPPTAAGTSFSAAPSARGAAAHRFPPATSADSGHDAQVSADCGYPS